MFPLRFIIWNRPGTDKSSVCRSGYSERSALIPNTFPVVYSSPSWPGLQSRAAVERRVGGGPICNGRRIFLCSLSGSSSGIEQGLRSPPCAELGYSGRAALLPNTFPDAYSPPSWMGLSEPGCRGGDGRGPDFCNGRRVFLCSLTGSSSVIEQGLTSPPCAELRYSGRGSPAP